MVLTFGDKPAPAMDQIALQKTAEENLVSHPQVAKTIKENSYMDDICDSVETVEKARKQTQDIDTVWRLVDLKSRNGHPIKPKRNDDMKWKCWKEIGVLGVRGWVEQLNGHVQG